MKVGDKVIVFSGLEKPDRAQMVSRVAGRKIVLDDGTWWNAATGERWGYTSLRPDFFLSYPFIRAHDPMYDIEIRRRYLLNRVATAKWDAMSDSQLERVIATLEVVGGDA